MWYNHAITTFHPFVLESSFRHSTIGNKRTTWRCLCFRELVLLAKAEKWRARCNIHPESDPKDWRCGDAKDIKYQSTCPKIAKDKKQKETYSWRLSWSHWEISCPEQKRVHSFGWSLDSVTWCLPRRPTLILRMEPNQRKAWPCFCLLKVQIASVALPAPKTLRFEICVFFLQVRKTLNCTTSVCLLRTISLRSPWFFGAAKGKEVGRKLCNYDPKHNQL